jgi:hypothetical protein
VEKENKKKENEKEKQKNDKYLNIIKSIKNFMILVPVNFRLVNLLS